ncbi:hypothetical protein V8E55_001818 [Tylopilus felleus]
MAYPFPTAHTSPSLSGQQYLNVAPPLARSVSRHSHHRAHSHSGHHDQSVVYPPNVGYSTHSDYQNPLHRHTSRSSHHSAYRHPSHSSHHLPQYVQSAHSHQSHTRSHSHSRPHAPTYHYPRERTPSMSDRIRNFFGMETRPDHYSQHHHQPHYPSHQYAHSNDHRRRHNSFSGFRDDSRPHRSNSVRAGPWFFGSVDNRRYIDEHGREVDHHGRVIHRM